MASIHSISVLPTQIIPKSVAEGTHFSLKSKLALKKRTEHPG
jgi:hypothetical protein